MCQEEVGSYIVLQLVFCGRVLLCCPGSSGTCIPSPSLPPSGIIGMHHHTWPRVSGNAADAGAADAGAWGCDVGACTSASADDADAGSGADTVSGAVLTVLMHATLLVCLYYHLYTPATKGCTQM